MNKKRIMIVDDDEGTIELMTKLIEPLYETVAFRSGEKALESLEEAPDMIPSLILLDISMEEMDGYEVLSRLKGDERYKKIPVVFLTGMTDEVSECRGLEMDVVDYLKKPVPGKVLLARIQLYLDLYSNTSAKGSLDEEKISEIPEPLTNRELEVARLMADFRSDREICDILYISMPYAKKLVSAVKEKLFLEKRGDIRRYLIQ